MELADLKLRFSTSGEQAAIGALRQVDAGIKGVESSAKSGGGALKTMFATAGGFVLGGAIRSAVADIGGLVKGALDFNQEMANVNSIAQLTDRQIAKLSDTVNLLGTKTAQSPEALAEALYNIYSSGFQGSAALDVLTASANAATAGITTADVAAQAITATMNAYGQETYTAQQLSDVFFQTVNDGVLTFEQFANNLGKTLPLASNLGVGIDELAAAYAQLTLNGINASAAETDIAALMTQALKPTDALTQAAIDYGYASVQALVSAKGLPGLVRAITLEANGNAQALGDMLPNQEAVNAALILGKDDAAAYTAEVDKMNKQLSIGGATQKALEKQQQSVNYALREAKIAVQETATVLIAAMAPAIILVAQGLSLFVVNGLLPAAQAFEHFAFIFERAFAQGPQVVTLLAHLPGPLRGISGAFLDTADYLGRLFRGVQDVFGSGRGIEHYLRGVPEPLREMTRGFLRVSDSIGDLVQRWKSKGFDAMLQTLPRELNAIVRGLGEVARGAVSAVVDFAISGAITLGGDLLDAAGDLVGWVKDRIAGGDWATLAVAAIPILGFGPLEIVGAIKLGGDLADAQGHIWTWVKSKLYGDAGASLPSMFGSGGTDVAFDNTLSVGTVITDGVLKLGDALSTWAGNLVGWVRQQLLGISGDTKGLPGDVAAVQAMNIPLGTLTIDAGLKLAADIYGGALSLWGWFLREIGVQGQLGQQVNGTGAAVKPISLGDVVVTGTLKPAADFALNAGTALAGAITDATEFATPIAKEIWSKITDVDWASIITVDSFTTGRDITTPIHDALVAAVKAGFNAIKDVDISTDDLTTAFSAIGKGVLAAASAAPLALVGGGTAFMSAIAGGLTGLAFGDADISAIGGNILTQIQDAIFGNGGGTFPGLSTESGTTGIVGSITAFFTDLPGQVKDAVGTLSLDIPSPTLPSWLDGSDWSWIDSFVTGVITHLAGAIKSIFSKLGELYSAGAQANQANYANMPYGGNAPSGPQMGTGSGASGPNTNNASPNAVPVSIRYTATYDDSAIPNPLKGLFGGGDPPKIHPVMATFDADIQPFVGRFAEVMELGSGFARAIFAAHLDADASSFFKAVGIAELAGIGFSSQVYSATITADFSGAVSAAQSAAAEISSYLPHSPAAKGALRTLPRWSALFEGIGPAGNHAVGLISGHAAMIASAFGASASARAFSGGGAPGGVTVYQLNGVNGRGAIKEIQRMAATGTGKIVRGNQRSSAYAGAKLP